jgi:DNA ligase-1
MLAETITDFSRLQYPLLASPKLDGIRAVNLDGALVSRSLKPIPNAHVQALFGGSATRFFDGELICGDPTAEDVYRKTNSAVLSQDGEPEVTWYLFDYFESAPTQSTARLSHLREVASGVPNCVVLDQHLVTCEDALLALEEKALAQGYEGLILRALDGTYKYGRSTEKEGLLLKLKRWATDEAEILEVVELEHNRNEKTVNALGYAERSSHKENKVGGGTMGSLRVRDLKTGAVFSIGTGFTAKDRAAIWAEKEAVIGKIVSYNHFPIGVKDLPRFPTYKGFRSKADMGERK